VLGVLDPGLFPVGADDLALRFAADMRAARLSSNPRADIRRWKYGKLLTSLNAALLALCGPEADTAELRRRLRQEGEAVLTAAGIDFVTESQQAARRVQASMTVKSGSAGSTWQSLARGSGSVESDYLNGEIVMLGRLFGVGTPYNRAVRLLVAALVREHGAPGSVTPAEVMSRAAKT
jgi:2-dehydropantoate 2-reductase